MSNILNWVSNHQEALCMRKAWFRSLVSILAHWPLGYLPCFTMILKLGAFCFSYIILGVAVNSVLMADWNVTNHRICIFLEVKYLKGEGDHLNFCFDPMLKYIVCVCSSRMVKNCDWEDHKGDKVVSGTHQSCPCEWVPAWARDFGMCFNWTFANLLTSWLLT